MKWMMALAAALMISGTLAIAESTTAPATTAPATKAAVKTVNTICPVSDEAPMDEPVIVSVDGKDYMLCCKMCKKEWDKDPAKFIKAMEEHPEKYGIKK